MSNVIKFTQYIALDDKKVVEVAVKPELNAVQDDSSEAGNPHLEELNEAIQIKEQILQDAEAFAEEQVKAAMEEAAAIRQQVQAESELWWNEQRQRDLDLQNQLKDEGFQQGYQDGLKQSEAELREQYDGMLQEASQILDQAYILKQQIIQESEPFLIELSCSIAEKIVERQLTIESEWIVELVQKVLSRRREKGIITLCVAPVHFSNIQDAREELLLHIDSQAELQIIPDPSVHDQGCVVRSSFGSIDARIDTQLKEIKNALQHLAVRNEGN
ncbi:FliH/SctL family protein [Paenibacillus radicis (ex Xue et al. 2023)]|uniref:FliH/SctL family protein n=1 Tax=Paenibacillus radicis (ex Xue et al. 2023) TaxID=2972489 RepID=A0ABT1YC87_9BACL|nr:FliH/SctL family protein [Paenibacillus radicis (ex Xue et al. 2023)]MCR8630814.1 FliH/SctL family protein [Paenibacillus radicis (ex Xue et al. 2023)]